MKKAIKKKTKQIQAGLETLETNFITKLGPKLKKLKAKVGGEFPVYCRSAGIPEALAELAIEYVDTVEKAVETNDVDLILKSNLRFKLADLCMKLAGDTEGIGANAALHFNLPTN